MIRYVLIFIGWLFLLAGSLLTMAQGDDSVVLAAGQAAFLTEADDVLVGQPVPLRLVAVLPMGAELTEWPTFTEVWGSFMLRDMGEVVAQQDTDGRITYTQTFTALLWDVGEHITPETAIRFMVEGVQAEVLVSPFHFNVMSVLDGTDDQLRPLKAPVDLTYVPLWLVGLGTLLVIGLSFFGARILPAGVAGRQERYRGEVVSLPPLQAALGRLQQMTKDQVAPVEAYAQTADVLRGYLQTQFTVQAQDMTTVELVRSLPEKLPDLLVQDLQRLLSQADLVKFARYTPDKAAAERYMAFAQRWLISAEKHRPDSDEDEA